MGHVSYDSYPLTLTSIDLRTARPIFIVRIQEGITRIDHGVFANNLIVVESEAFSDFDVEALASPKDSTSDSVF
jgi:hypothetical protein